MAVSLTHSKAGKDHIFKPLKDKKEFVDAKMCSEYSKDKFVLGHRTVLGVMSSIWKRQFLKSTNIEEPIVVKNMDHDTILKIIDFIYSGKIVIPEDEFEDFSNACRMINLRLGGQTDRIIYDMDSDDEEDDEEEKSPVKMAPARVVKKELNPDMWPTSSNVPFTDPSVPSIPGDLNIAVRDPIIPNASADSVTMSCVSGIKHKKKLKLEPPSPQPQQVHVVQPEPSNDLLMTDQELPDKKPIPDKLSHLPQSDEPAPSSASVPQVKRMKMSPEQLDEAATNRGVCPNALKKGPRGYYWISVTVDTDLKRSTIKDTCVRFGEIMDFLQYPHLPDVVHVAYKGEQEAKNGLNILKICGYPTCHNTTNLPQGPQDSKSPEQNALNVDTSVPPPPPALCMPPPMLSQPPPPLPSGDVCGMFRQFGMSPPHAPFATQPPNLGVVSEQAKQYANARNDSRAANLWNDQRSNPNNPANVWTDPRSNPNNPENAWTNHANQRSDQRANKRPPTVQVYIGNLPNATSIEHLSKLLRKHQVPYISKSLRVHETINKQNRDRKKTYAFLHCNNQDEADYLISKINGVNFRKRNLVVKDAAEGQRTRGGSLGRQPPAMGIDDDGQERGGFQRRDSYGREGTLGRQPMADGENGQERGEFEIRESSGWDRTLGRQLPGIGMDGEDEQERGGFRSRELSGREGTLGGQPPAMGMDVKEDNEERGFKRREITPSRDIPAALGRQPGVDQNSVAVCEPDTSQPTLNEYCFN